MLIRPGEMDRWKVLLPRRKIDWAGPSAGLEGQITWWRIFARLDDGKWVWRGITKDREDFDAFVAALIRFYFSGIPIPKSTKRLMRGDVPVVWNAGDGPNRNIVLRGMECEWHEGIVCTRYDFDQYWQLHPLREDQHLEREWSVPLDWNNGGIWDGPGYTPVIDDPHYWPGVDLQLTPGSYLLAATPSPTAITNAWNNNNNLIEAIGPGGSGAVGANSTGGGGGGYASGANVPLVRGGSQPFAVGSDASPVPASPTAVAGNASPADSVLGATTIPAAGALVGAAKGGAGATASPGGVGALGPAGKPASGTRNAGGSSTNPGAAAAGGGGGGGPFAAGSNAGASPPGTSAGGRGDGTHGGPGSAAVTTSPPLSSAAGSTGTEMDASHGSGGGSGGIKAPVGTPGNAMASGAGGSYGAGSGGAANPLAGNPPTPGNTQSSGRGGHGLIAITNTLGGLWLPPPMTGIGDGGPYFGSGLNSAPRMGSPMTPAGKSFSGWSKPLV